MVYSLSLFILATHSFLKDCSTVETNVNHLQQQPFSYWISFQVLWFCEFLKFSQPFDLFYFLQHVFAK